MSDPQLPMEVPHEGKSTGGAVVPVQAFPHPVARPDFAPPTALSITPNARELLKALRRRWLSALLVGLTVAAGAGAAMWFLLPQPKQTARVQLYVPFMQPHLLFPGDNRVNGNAFLQNQAYLIKDQFTLNTALNMDGIADLPVLKERKQLAEQLQWMESEIKVEFPGPEFIQISMSGDRPRDLLLLLRAVRKAYLNKIGESETDDREIQLKILKDTKRDYERRSNETKRKLRQAQTEAGGLDEINIALMQKIALEDLEAVKRELNAVRVAIRQLRIEMGLHPDWTEEFGPRYAFLASFPFPGLPMHVAVVGLLHQEALLSSALAAPEGVEDVLASDPIIGPQLKKIHELELLIAEIRPQVNPNVKNSKAEGYIKRHQEEVDRIRKHIDESVKSMGGKAYLERMRRQGAPKEQTGSPRERLRAAQAMEKAYLAEIERLAQLTANKNKAGMDLADYKEEIAKFDVVIQSAYKRIEALEIEQKAPARVRPFGEGSIHMPDPTWRKVRFTGAVTGAVLVLVLLAVAWGEFLTRKVHNPQEVVEGLGMRLVGTVPPLPQPAWRGWRRPESGDPAFAHSLPAESVDSAQTLVLHAARTDKLQIVMITSALPGEGKTSLAGHLAASLARAGHRTLLLDSDLHNPSLHRLFDMSRGPGLSEILRGEMGLPGAIRETPISNLWLISAGQKDLVALQTLALDNIRHVFDQLRPQYEFILVDSCPVLPVADSLLVGQHVDAVIFSLLREISRLPRVYEAYQRLAMLGVRILGAVVNGVRQGKYGAGYGNVSTEED
jgi:capsular exopolysaccharide synthesis family protein